jgi:hypothetical protein
MIMLFSAHKGRIQRIIGGGWSGGRALDFQRARVPRCVAASARAAQVRREGARQGDCAHGPGSRRYGARGR